MLSEWDAIRSAQVVYYVPTRRRVETRFDGALATFRKGRHHARHPAANSEQFETTDDSGVRVQPELGSPLLFLQSDWWQGQVILGGK